MFAALLAPVVAPAVTALVSVSLTDTINEGINPKWDGTFNFAKTRQCGFSDTQRKLMMLQLHKYGFITLTPWQMADVFGIQNMELERV